METATKGIMVGSEDNRRCGLCPLLEFAAAGKRSQASAGALARQKSRDYSMSSS